MKILLAGEKERAEMLRARLQTPPDWEVDYSDGDEEEDFDLYDIIFDLNFDDDNSNFPLYASLKEKMVFVSAAKQSLSESVFIHQAKVKCMLFGINAIPAFLNDSLLEISLFRKFEMDDLKAFTQKVKLDFLPVEDRTGMVKPRVMRSRINQV